MCLGTGLEVLLLLLDQGQYGLGSMAEGRWDHWKDIVVVDCLVLMRHSTSAKIVDISFQERD